VVQTDLVARLLGIVGKGDGAMKSDAS